MTFLEHDVTDAEQWRAVVDQVLGDAGHLDVLVNNAAIFRKVSLPDTTRELWDRMLRVNQTSVFLGMQTISYP